MTSSPAESFLLYGATGYTGELIATRARATGQQPLLAGRDRAALSRLAHKLDLPYRVCGLDDATALEALLRDVGTVVNAAGPVARTAGKMIEACLRTGTHYLDIAAEVEVFDLAYSLDQRARALGLMLMPGVGFDVVPSDCLAAHVSRLLPSADWLRIGISGLELLSRGSARTLAAQSGRPIQVRRGGQRIGVSPGSLDHSFDFGGDPRLGSGVRAACAVSWADVTSAFAGTGIPNIEVYFEQTQAVQWMSHVNQVYGAWLNMPLPQTLMRGAASWLPAGPSEFERMQRRTCIVAEVQDIQGHRRSARLHLPEAYTLTAMTASEVARRVAGGEIRAGYCSPAMLFGPDFILEFDGARRVDLG